MKKEEFVELGMDEALAEKCAKASQDELKGFIPKRRFDEVNEEKKSLDKALQDRDKQLEQLNKSTGDVDELMKQIKALQEDNKTATAEHKAEVKQLKINNAVDAALLGAKVKNTTAVKALLKDLDKAELAEDGTIKGLDEQIKALQESDSYLFETKKDKAEVKGAKPGEGEDNPDNSTITKEMFNDMSYKEKVNLYNTDKALYDTLAK